MFCSKCGKELNDGVMFCSYCGAKVGEGATEKKGKKVIIPVVLAAIVIAVVGIVTLITRTHKKGDIITFGNYEQDGNLSNGAEPIEWEVLDNNEKGTLLISKYILDAKAFNDEKTDVTWETCTLRKWLNEGFYDSAFTEDEKKKIKLTEVENNDNAKYGTDGGNDTEDKVFLLSEDEILKYYDFNAYKKEEGYGYCEDLITEGTQYALDNRLWIHKITEEDYEELNSILKGKYESNNVYSLDIIGKVTGWWWLRSPGYDLRNTCLVNCGGYAGAFYRGNVDDCRYGVRPALYLKK